MKIKCRVVEGTGGREEANGGKMSPDRDLEWPLSEGPYEKVKQSFVAHRGGTW